jgi:hypothetical protein
MANAEQKRAFVASLYVGPGWMRRVANMLDDQITAIYLDHQGEKQHRLPKPKPEPVQEHLDIPLGHGPHANEDEFQII